MHIINYELIAKAIHFYETYKKYKYIDVPWTVSKGSIDVTRPPGARPFFTHSGYLVASGEQSFLEIRRELCPGRKYQCVTPCFRDEKYDDLHFPYFLKNELIIPLWKDDSADEFVQQILKDAYSFFGGYCNYPSPDTVKTDIGFDIVIAGMEVGSYGYREHEGFRWVYGTGCAEPRFSQAMIERDRLHEIEMEELTRS